MKLKCCCVCSKSRENVSESVNTMTFFEKVTSSEKTGEVVSILISDHMSKIETNNGVTYCKNNFKIKKEFGACNTSFSKSFNFFTFFKDKVFCFF